MKKWEKAEMYCIEFVATENQPGTELSADDFQSALSTFGIGKLSAMTLEDGSGPGKIFEPSCISIIARQNLVAQILRFFRIF